MIRAILVITALLQIIVAMQTDGLIRALAELGAFLMVLAIVLSFKKGKRKKLQQNIEPL